MKFDDCFMNIPKITVIVPVYNVDKYLHRCVDSILSQTYTKLEILLIDDGSIDNSSAICDFYAEKDTRIKVYHKENGGVSSARNLGLKKSTGEFVIFCDADDWLSEDYINENDFIDTFDILQKSYAIFNESTQSLICHINVKNRLLLDKKSIFKFFTNKRNNALWDKIIRRDIIGNICFCETVSIGEDFLFFLELLDQISNYKFSNVGCYFYSIRQGSIMNEVKYRSDVKLSIIYSNMVRVRSICSTNSLFNVGESIVYLTYVNSIMHKEYLRILSVDQNRILRSNIKALSITKIKYLTMKNKLILLFNVVKYFVFGRFFNSCVIKFK